MCTNHAQATQNLKDSFPLLVESDILASLNSLNGTAGNILDDELLERGEREHESQKVRVAVVVNRMEDEDGKVAE